MLKLHEKLEFLMPNCYVKGLGLGSNAIFDVDNTTVCLKKTPLKEMCNFLTLKMLPLALALIKTKNRHLFDPLVKN